MKLTPNNDVPVNQTKAFSLLIACLASSVIFSMTVVTYVVRWMMQS